MNPHEAANTMMLEELHHECAMTLATVRTENLRTICDCPVQCPNARVVLPWCAK
jgi:hypothetical protein